MGANECGHVLQKGQMVHASGKQSVDLEEHQKHVSVGQKAEEGISRLPRLIPSRLQLMSQCQNETHLQRKPLGLGTPLSKQRDSWVNCK